MISLLLHEGQNRNALKENFVNTNGVRPTHGHVAPLTNGDRLPDIAHNDNDIVIRRYRAEDRPSIYRICCDTGFLGNPIETIFSDREIFADLFAGPYLNYGPNWAWVAESGGQVIGYLLGSVSPFFDYTLLYSGFQTTVKMIARAATGSYSSHPRTRHFIRWLLTHGYREQPRHPNHAAHLHLNLDKAWRGRGLGLRLWQAYEQQLDKAGIRDCYGAFFSWTGRRPEMVYSRLGFSVFDRKLTTIFQPEIQEPVEVVCVQKKIAS